MNLMQAPQLKVPLGKEAHRFAQEFAIQQATPQKGKRVYLNTLAVYAVHSYLKWLQIETNLNQSDSWHPGKQTVLDSADLVIPGIGHLECRSLLPGETVVDLPLEATENRIGYVGVQFNEYLNEVQLLGFTPAVDSIPPQLLITDFQPLETLIDHMYQLRQQQHQLKAVRLPSVSATPATRVNLSQWLQNTFDEGWQTIETLLNSERANFAVSFRSAIEAGVRRGKLIDLGMLLAGHPIALLVALTPTAEQEVDILLQLHPTGSLAYLPPNLQLLVLDQTGTQVLEAIARSADNYIQLQFSGEFREVFTIKVALGEVSVTEDFVI